MKLVKIMCIVFIAVFIASASSSVFAISELQPESSYYNFNYNDRDQAVQSPAGYIPEKQINNIENAGNLKNPTDSYVTDDNEIFILDAGNNRILMLDENFSLIKIINPVDENKKKIEFEEATGIFVKNTGEILVADEKAQNVYIFNENGELIDNLAEPESDILPQGFLYSPQRILCDEYGVYYVLSKGSYSGILQYKNDKTFSGFFGAERVTVTAALLIDKFWKSLLSQTQAESMSKYVSAEYISIDIDKKGFIYAVKNDTDWTFMGQLSRLNPLGQNVLWHKQRGGTRRYGEMEVVFNPQVGYIDSQFTDVAFDENGFINMLDERKGRIYQYDLNANLIFIFGGLGEEQGTTQKPVSINTIDDRIIVIDKEQSLINVYKRTRFGELYQKGISLLNDGENDKTAEIWNEILKVNKFDRLANLGMGKNLAAQGEYNQALEYFKRAGSKEGYSDAFNDYRSILLTQLFPLILIAMLSLVILPFVVSAYRKRHPVNEYEYTVSAKRMPLYSIFHPFKAFTLLKDEKQGKLSFSIIIVILFFIISIIKRQATGYLFNDEDPETFNIFYMFLSTVGLFVFFVVANWAVSTLIDGEGKFKEIVTFTGYALLPFVLFSIPVVLLSCFFTLEESAFYMIFQNVVYIWTGITLIMAVKEAHQFNLKRCIGSILLTLVGMVFIITIIAIIYSVTVQLVGFIESVIMEVALR